MTDFASQRNASFFDLVSLGRLPGWSVVRIAGRNPAVSTATVPEDIWNTGGLYPFQTTAQLLEVLSASANDVTGGTGARTVLITGLDGNYNDIIEVLAMNGVTPVITAQRFLRVNRFAVLTAGSGESNVGAITLRVSPAGVTQATIDVSATQGDGIAYMGVYTVPLGRQLWVPYFVADIQFEPVGTVVLHFKVRAFGGAWFSITQLSLHSQGSSYIEFQPPAYLFGPEKADFRVTAVTSTALNIPITVALSGILGPMRAGG